MARTPAAGRSQGISVAALGRYIAGVPDWRLPPRARQRLARFLALCDRLPETQIAMFGERHLAIKFRAKAFAYYLNQHHDDGVACACCKSTRQRQSQLISQDPKRFLVPAYLGPSGWVSIRLDLPSVNWKEVESLLTQAFMLAAPKRLAARLTGSLVKPHRTPKGQADADDARRVLGVPSAPPRSLRRKR